MLGPRELSAGERYTTTAFELAEMFLYAALDPAVAGKARKGDFRRGSDVQVLVQRAHAVVRHQDLHLALWQVLDLFVLGPVLALFPFRRAHALLETLEAEELLPNY